jgi:hypothetical protein
LEEWKGGRLEDGLKRMSNIEQGISNSEGKEILSRKHERTKTRKRILTDFLISQLTPQGKACLNSIILEKRISITGQRMSTVE